MTLTGYGIGSLLARNDGEISVARLLAIGMGRDLFFMKVY